MAVMHYSDAAENDPISQEVSACAGCVTTEQAVDAYTESLRSKMHMTLQDMILHAGIGVALFDGGPAFQWST